MHTIRKYRNRKLYDTDLKTYITLVDLGEEIRGGKEIRIVDHETQADITAEILTEIIFVEEKKGPRLGVEVLTRIIREGLAA